MVVSILSSVDLAQLVLGWGRRVLRVYGVVIVMGDSSILRWVSSLVGVWHNALSFGLLLIQLPQVLLIL